MLRSLGKLVGIDPGFRPDGVLTMRLAAREGLGRDSLPEFYRRIEERISALPGVKGVGIQDCLPLSGGCNSTVIDLRDRPPATPGEEPDVGVHWVSPSWHQVAGVPLVRGRFLFARRSNGEPEGGPRERDRGPPLLAQ